MSCFKRVESEETLDISGPIHDGGAPPPGEGESDFALVMRNWGERGITAKQLNVKKGDVIKVPSFHLFVLSLLFIRSLVFFSFFLFSLSDLWSSFRSFSSLYPIFFLLFFPSLLSSTLFSLLLFSSLLFSLSPLFSYSCSLQVIERYPIGLWLGELNGERGIFDSKCTVACSADGTPLKPVNEADWVEVQAETPEERKVKTRICCFVLKNMVVIFCLLRERSFVFPGCNFLLSQS
jgi:hypothetical protein